MNMIDLARKVWWRVSSGGLSGLSRNGYYYFRRRFQVPANAVINHTRLRLSRKYAALASPVKLLYVSPDRIRYKSRADFNKRRDMGRIVAGDWDLNRRAFSDTIRYRAIEKRYCEGLSWEETGIIDYHYKKIGGQNGNHSSDGCFSLEDVRARYESIDEMYEHMKTNGYDENKTQNRFDHPYIHIGRDGELLHASVGNHRLSVAKVLGLESIPVFVVVRHADWQQRRETVATGELELGAVDHPDLTDLV